MHLISSKHRKDCPLKCCAAGCDTGIKYVLENGRLACNLHAIACMSLPVSSKQFYEYDFLNGIIDRDSGKIIFAGEANAEPSLDGTKDKQ